MPPVVGRLKRRSDFLRVAGAKRKWVAPGLILQARSQATDDPKGSDESPTSRNDVARVGFTVSRKVGNAVERNRVRRRLRAAVAQVFPSAAVGGTDFVVIGRKEALKRPFSALVGDLETAMKKLSPSAGTAASRARAK